MFTEPATGERFFGRDDVLALLSKRVMALKEGYRQNVAFTGQSLSGKTSILHHFISSIKDDDFITVYVEIRPEPFCIFARKFVATLLYNSLVKLGIPVEADPSRRVMGYPDRWLRGILQFLSPGTGDFKSQSLVLDSSV